MLETRLTRGSCTSSWDPGVFESRAERLPVCAHGFRELIVCLASPKGHDARTVYVPAWAAYSVVPTEGQARPWSRLLPRHAA